MELYYILFPMKRGNILSRQKQSCVKEDYMKSCGSSRFMSGNSRRTLRKVTFSIGLKG